MRLLEEIFEKGATGISDPKELMLQMADVQVFRIDNVAEYLYAETDQEVWDVKKDFPCLAPPFESFWMEHGRPSRLVSCETGIRSSERMPYRHGMWFVAGGREKIRQASAPGVVKERFLAERARLFELLDKRLMTPDVIGELNSFKDSGGDLNNKEQTKHLSPPARMALEQMAILAGMEKLRQSGKLEDAAAGLIKPSLHWVMECYSFMQFHRHQQIYGPVSRQIMELDADGNVLDIANMVFPDSVGRAHMENEEREGFTTSWFPGLLAISFTHCKNVTMCAEEKPPILKKKQLRDGRPCLTFRVLEISPMKRVLRQAGAEVRSEGLRRALHICRGHFASYEDRGLFGKYRGRFWIPQHLRGTKEAGLVVKDYAVKPRA